jgi:hypothetical protein
MARIPTIVDFELLPLPRARATFSNCMKLFRSVAGKQQSFRRYPNNISAEMEYSGEGI